MLLSRQPVLHTHDELYVQTLIDESAVHKPSCTVDVGRIEDFDLGKHAEFPHLCRPTASRKLNDHLGTVFAHALLHLSKQDAIGSRGFIRLAHVDVNEGDTRIE